MPSAPVCPRELESRVRTYNDAILLSQVRRSLLRPHRIRAENHAYNAQHPISNTLAMGGHTGLEDSSILRTNRAG